MVTDSTGIPETPIIVPTRFQAVSRPRPHSKYSQIAVLPPALRGGNVLVRRPRATATKPSRSPSAINHRPLRGPFGRGALALAHTF